MNEFKGMLAAMSMGTVLHHKTGIHSFRVLKVPGGWIFYTLNHPETGVYVPEPIDFYND